MAVNRYNDTRSWYAVSTYSGYEDKVADSIKQRLDSVDFANKIFDVLVPKEKQILMSKNLIILNLRKSQLRLIKKFQKIQNKTIKMKQERLKMDFLNLVMNLWLIVIMK